MCPVRILLALFDVLSVLRGPPATVPVVPAHATATSGRRLRNAAHQDTALSASGNGTHRTAR
eukprot:43963-Alexandrium_andersonii.AAC.1